MEVQGRLNAFRFLKIALRVLCALRHHIISIVSGIVIVILITIIKHYYY